MKNRNSLSMPLSPTHSIHHSRYLKSAVQNNFLNADYQFDLLKKSILAFEEELDHEHEISVMLASFGQSILMQVTEIGYSNPSLIHFYGYINGMKSQLIQHVSQLNFLLMAAPKEEPDKPARRIGFLSAPGETSNSYDVENNVSEQQS